jgi:hypothetical protein
VNRLPALLIYDGDWMKDEIAGCSLAAQGFMLRIMFIGHSSARYGYLTNPDGSALSLESITRRCGCTSVEECRSLVAELDSVNKLSRTPDGIIFLRRMVRDGHKRALHAARQARYRGKTSHDADDDARSYGENDGPSQGYSFSSSTEEVVTQEAVVTKQKPVVKKPSAPRSTERDAGMPVIGTLPCVGGKNWGFTQKDLDGWSKTYTAVDVMHELREMRQWLLANHKRTHKGMRRFIVNWLSREHDRSPVSHGKPQGNHAPAKQRVNGAYDKLDQAAKRKGWSDPGDPFAPDDSKIPPPGSV